MRYLFEDYALDSDRRELRRGADLVALAPQVFDLLHYLIQNRERVVSKDDLIAGVWDGRVVSDSALTTRINAARSAIGDSGDKQRLIKTVPRKGIRFVGTAREDQAPAAAAVAASPSEPLRPTLTLPDKPSIAILPFANLSSDQEQEYLADGIVGDTITGLSRFGELFVIARNSSFQYKGKAADVRQVGRDLGVRYVLEGTVRRAGDRLRISAQLIDAATGVHRWAEHYDRKLEDVFAVQDEVVHTIVAILAAHVRKAETERTRAKPPDSWQTYDYFLQAADALSSFQLTFNVEDVYQARRLLLQSLALDASYARSHALLSHMHQVTWANPLDSDYLSPAALDQAYQLALKAVQLDANQPEAHAILGQALGWKHQHDASLAHIERAIALNPNHVDWRLGLPLVLAGEARRAIEVLEPCTRLDPFYPPVAAGMLGIAHYMLKQYAQAMRALRDCVSRAPNYSGGHRWLAMTYAQLGRMEEARAEVAEVLRIEPKWSNKGVGARKYVFKRPEDAEHLFDGLRTAGLPD